MNKHATIKKSFIHTVRRRVMVIFFYLALFAFFLYVPLLRDFFINQKTLNVCVFSETFTQEAISAFEQETGVKVNITYVEMDDQIFAKFRMNGAAGYDVVNISDFVVHSVGQSNQLAPLEKTALPSLGRIDPNLLNLHYDYANVFSVPHKWYVYGLVYDTQFFKQDPGAMSLTTIFEDPKGLVKKGLVSSAYRICMLDDARDAIFLACIFLFGRVDKLSEQDLAAARDLLVRQKEWVEAYTLHSSQYFLFSGVTPIALMSSNYMRKILESSDQYAFAIPQEGSMLIVENLAIPATSKKVELAHQFINFMLRDDIATLNSSFYGFNSANWHANQALDTKLKNNKHLFPTTEMFKRLYIPLLPEEQRKSVEDRWLEVSFS
jgi:spermidine/putrescine transport system substrate-binding protein